MARKLVGKEHNLEEVVKFLSKKRDCKLDLTNERVYALTGDTEKDPKAQAKYDDLGNGSWGRIDFLTNHSGWALIKVEKFPR